MSQRWTSGSMTATAAVGACCVGCGRIYHTSVRLRVARSIQMGTCQSLKKQNEQLIRFLRFFCFYIFAGLRIYGICSIAMNKIFRLLSLMLMTSATLTLASCGDEGGGSGSDSDDDFEHSGNVVPSADICNFGGQRLKKVGESYEFIYNTDGSIHKILDGYYDITFYYDKGVMTISCSEFTRDTHFTTNSKGYITEIRESGEDGVGTFRGVYSFKYNNADHLTYVSAETNTYESGEVVGTSTSTWTLTWSNELLSHIYFCSDDWDRYGSMSSQEESTYSYTDAPENIYMQYTGSIVNDIYFYDYLEALMYVGLFGKAPAYYPTKIIETEVGSTFTQDNSYEYNLNSHGLVETEETRYDGGPSSSTKYVYSSSL